MEKKKLKIGYDAKRLFMNNTGLGNYSRTLVRNKKANDPEIEIHLFTPKALKNRDTAHFLEGDYIVHECPKYLPTWLWRTWLMSHEINALKLDVFHGLSQELPYGINKEVWKIVTIHDLIAEVYPRLFAWYDAWIYRYKYKSAVTRADEVVAISKSTASDIVKYYHIPKEKIKVVYQTCNDVFIKTPLAPRHGEYYLYVGTINERKGLMDIVDAMMLLSATVRKKVKVVGDGGDYKNKVMQRITELGLEPYFEFLGSQSNEDLVSLYDGCIALILPSQYEGFGIPIIEALHRAKPVITYDNSSLPEAAGPGGIIVTTGDVRALSEAMTKIRDVELNEKLGMEGKGYVSREM